VGGLSALPLSAAAWAGRRLGDALRLLDGRHRRRVREQAAERLGLSGRALDRFVRDNFHSYGMALAEFAHLSRMNPEDFEKHIDGMEPFGHFVRSLLEEGKGAILVTAHFGNWEWCNSVARPLGFYGGSIARPLDNPRLNEFVRSVRERNGLRIFDKAGAIRKALGALRENHLVGVLIDQDAGRTGLMSPFLGKAASTLTIPVELAIRTGCPLVTVGLRRNTGANARPDGKRFTLVYGTEPYRPDPNADADAGAEAKRLTDALNAGLSAMILDAPEQWFWLHRRWKSVGKQ
jgi:KDO2-lipid IV(A) lauroyltransferase